ncbi:DUF4124 domain-containing protein [Roseateles sp. BYS87W]|uniref:DUF4124 domain-containing protein n=1 Tax=Pelomonas baiyunensis TaxID=3299026 RepID=A0ABW7GXK5_9BURK
MATWAAVATLALWAPQAQAQQVWKCEVDGQVRFSDKPCPGTGQPLAERKLQANVVEALKPEVVHAAMGRPPLAPADGAGGPPANVCPSEGEIRNMETRASSNSLGAPERQFMQDEARRALQCRAGQGRYTEADWAVSREAQAAQSQLSERARQEARARAEARHSAAHAVEGDRIAQRRLEEEKTQRRNQELQQRGQNPASAPRP